jgi:hypothetical protein
LAAFREFEKQELVFVSKFKKGELAVDKGLPFWWREATALISTRCFQAGLSVTNCFRMAGARF